LQFWCDTPTYLVVLYSALSTLASWFGLALGMQMLGIDHRLKNLKFMHLPVLDLITTGVHGFAFSLYFIAASMTCDHFLDSAMAFMLGDYTGSFLVLTCLWLALRWLRSHNPEGNTRNL